jgi:hypothetical protein
MSPFLRKLRNVGSYAIFHLFTPPRMRVKEENRWACKYIYILLLSLFTPSPTRACTPVSACTRVCVYV